jgi:hypothetical protein
LFLSYRTSLGLYRHEKTMSELGKECFALDLAENLLDAFIYIVRLSTHRALVLRSVVPG